jgi:hypothetical protein
MMRWDRRNLAGPAHTEDWGRAQMFLRTLLDYITGRNKEEDHRHNMPERLPGDLDLPSPLTRGVPRPGRQPSEGGHSPADSDILVLQLSPSLGGADRVSVVVVVETAGDDGDHVGLEVVHEPVLLGNPA